MRLDAVRNALLDDARRSADEIVAEADREAAAAVQVARQRADELLVASQAEGEAEAQRTAEGELARARRRAREVVLAARRDAYEQARREIRHAATQLRNAPDGPAFTAALSRLAVQQLGGDAEVAVDTEVGGVTARAGDRSVDYRLPSVAERHFERLGDRVEQLWR